MLKYFNENISLALQERYRDLYEYRKTEAVEEGSHREAKVPKIAEEGENVGGGGAFENAAPPFNRLLEQPKEEDSFVASWLHNSFKMTAAEGNHPPNNTETPGGSALDLRAAPLSLHIPALQQAEAQRQFKMEFWNRSRPGSPEAHEQLGPPPTPQPPATPDHKTMTEKLVNEIQLFFLFFSRYSSHVGTGQQQQQSPSADSTMSERSLVPFALPQQQSPTGDAAVGDRNSMLPFALQQARSGQSISERTLEECWSTLQRVSWHLFQCVLLSSKGRGRAAVLVDSFYSKFEL
ncbi:Uncharacterized protein OBRU01_01694 [Operophtera brumata]|uniref:Uncharacterized protein n=1 Tax=Operophtera brumata TaxID=104452 RepID=A0A0L7LTV8_OPEBR|nr:Uncharacterized protein OBRU01_01694 [Operophtera brumata]